MPTNNVPPSLRPDGDFGPLNLNPRKKISRQFDSPAGPLPYLRSAPGTGTIAGGNGGGRCPMRYACERHQPTFRPQLKVRRPVLLPADPFTGVLATAGPPVTSLVSMVEAQLSSAQIRRISIVDSFYTLNTMHDLPNRRSIACACMRKPN